MELWLKFILIFIIAITVITVFVFIASTTKKKIETNKITENLVSAASRTKLPPIDFNSLTGLPKPVAKYFRYVFSNGQKLIRTAKFQQVGVLRINPDSKNWSPFEASYLTSENPVAFIWDAKIKISSVLHVRVRDSFMDGIGAGKVSLMSAITMGSDENNPEINAGALYRYLAEAVWHPTALLPPSGVRWEAVDEKTAIAHLTKSSITIELEFRFNNRGEIIGVYSEGRYGKFADKYIRYPWEGFFKNYQEFNGVKIPTEGEVGWHLPEGWWLFWKGKIINTEFTSN